MAGGIDDGHDGGFGEGDVTGGLSEAIQLDGSEDHAVDAGVVGDRVAEREGALESEAPDLITADGKPPGIYGAAKVRSISESMRGIVGSDGAGKENAVGFDEAEVEVVGRELEEVVEINAAEIGVPGLDEEIDAAEGGKQLAGVADVAELVGGDQATEGADFLDDAILLALALMKITLEKEDKGGNSRKQHENHEPGAKTYKHP